MSGTGQIDLLLLVAGHGIKMRHPRYLTAVPKPQYGLRVGAFRRKWLRDMMERVAATKAKHVSDSAVIAIIEDDLGFRDALTELLQVFGLPCRSFDRAESFVDAYAEGAFCCAISDIRLPGISGLDLLKQLRELGSTLPFIMISSMTDPTIRWRAMNAGAAAFLSKPFSSDALAEHLLSALGRAFFPEKPRSVSGIGDL